jgi:hypothetical protein
MAKLFTRKVEDFVCEHCGASVNGNGYTNHCPKCLWSRHVDKNPGDRLEACHGMMEPISIKKKGSTYAITHRCALCGFTRNDSVREDDDFNTVIALSKKIAEKIGQGENTD